MKTRDKLHWGGSILLLVGAIAVVVLMALETRTDFSPWSPWPLAMIAAGVGVVAGFILVMVGIWKK